MKIKVHTGSIPVSSICRIDAEMLIAVDGCQETQPTIARMLDLEGCDTGMPFARTMTGIDVLDTRESQFPANKYGMRLTLNQFLGDNCDSLVDGIMRMVAGLGVTSLAIFTFSPVQYHSQEQELLAKIAEWLCSNDSSLRDIYELSNAVGNMKECSCDSLLKERPEFRKIFIDSGLVGRVTCVDSNWWYYSNSGNKTVKIDHVVRSPQFTHNLKKLAIPPKLDENRVVAIDDNAFVQTEADLLSTGEKVEDWTRILEELTIPPFVSQMNVTRILNSLPALECVSVDPQNHFFEMGEPFLIRKINGEHE